MSGTGTAHRRVINRRAAVAYVGASVTRRALQGWTPLGGDADRDSIPDLWILRERSRDLARNTPLAGGALNTLVTNVVGPGLRPQWRIDRDALGFSDEQADAWERKTEREFRLWSESQECDLTRTEHFYALQGLAFYSVLLSGDVFVAMPSKARKGMPYDTRIQFVEADRVGNPNGQIDGIKIAGGVEVDQGGAPVTYYISNRHPRPIGLGAGGDYQLKYEPYPAFGRLTGRRNIIHLFHRMRPGQRRGVPYLAPVIETLKQLGRYSDAELNAAVISGILTAFIQKEGGEPLESPISPDQQISDDPNVLELGHGNIVELEPGETVEMIDGKRPNQSFGPFVQAVLQEIGAALEIPHELLVKQYTASYSASRAALLEAWKFIKVRRHWLAWRFCQPVAEAWLDEAVAIGRVSAPGYFQDAGIRKAYTRIRWIGPAHGMIDPKKEIEAHILSINEGLSTRGDASIEINGSDWEENHRQLAKEERMRREDGLTGKGQDIVNSSQEAATT